MKNIDGISNDEYNDIQKYLNKIGDDHKHKCNYEQLKSKLKLKNPSKNNIEGCSDDELAKEQAIILSSDDDAKTQNDKLAKHGEEFAKKCFNQQAEKQNKRLQTKINDEFREFMEREDTGDFYDYYKQNEDKRLKAIKPLDPLIKSSICDNYVSKINNPNNTQQKQYDLYKEFIDNRCNEFI